jgi:FKBP-type peptidyl-prolyl cis-trans isomerase
LRNFALFFALLLLMFVGLQCAKSSTCTPRTAASETTEIQAYITANGLNAVAHSSGLYYEIINPGSGATPTLNSNISITYTGMMLNGTIFDQKTTPNNTQANPPWALSKLIEGWKIGIPLVKKGGHIKLVVPSSMAYGCTGFGIIPGNSILFFDINLVDVQ